MHENSKNDLLIKQKKLSEKLIKFTTFSIMDTEIPYQLLSDYSDLRSKEATDLYQHIDKITKPSNNKKDKVNKKDIATVDSYKLMVKIIDLQGADLRYMANENVKSLAAIQSDLEEAYILKANRFDEVISTNPNSRPSTNKIFNEDATLLRKHAGILSDNANRSTSPQSFAKSLADFYQERSNKFEVLGKSSPNSFEKDILKKHSKLLLKDSKKWAKYFK